MWEELYKGHYQELVAYGTRMSGDQELTEDLVQETFMKALMNVDTVEDLTPGKRRAWLYRTFKNLFFDRCRRSVLEQKYIQNLRLAPDQIEDDGIQEVETELFLQSIHPQDRVIFQLRYYEGYTAREISQMLHLPSGTIRSKLSRCWRHLKEQLGLV